MAIFSLHSLTKLHQSYITKLHRVDFWSGVVTVVSWYSSVHWHWYSKGKVRPFGSQQVELMELDGLTKICVIQPKYFSIIPCIPI